MLRRVKITTAAVLLLLLGACGNFDLVSAGDTTTPSGTLVAQAEFSDSLDVTGFASIYHQGGSSYILRLDTIAGASSTQSIRINASSGTLSIGAIGISSGAKNYSFTTTLGATFTSVEVLQGGSTVVGRALF